MKIYVPDQLLAYEQEILKTFLEERNHIPIFGEKDLQAEAIMTGLAPLDDGLLSSLKKLSGIVRFARGRFDLAEEREYCRANNLEYLLVSGASAQSTAEHTVMLMLALLRNLPEANRSMLSGNWRQNEIAEMGIRDFSEVKVGLIGMGKVGRQVATLLKAFGTLVLYYKPNRLPASEEAALSINWVDLDTLLKEVDLISLHSRAPDKNIPILGKHHVEMFKPGMIFINTGDGRHVDEKAIFDRARDGTLSVGLDVFAQEPWTPQHDFASQSGNYLFTPHLAGRSRRTATEIFRRACNAIDYIEKQRERKLSGQAPTHQSDANSGLLIRKVLGILAPRQPFRGYVPQITTRSRKELPEIGTALKMLGSTKVEWIQSDQQHIALKNRSYTTELLLQLSPSSNLENHEGDFSIARVPSLAFLLDRWQIDYMLWDYLLPRAARGSLPGRTIHIHGYGRRGKLIAWKARAIGMRTIVAEGNLQSRLDALYDGFQTVSAEAHSTNQDHLVVRTDPKDIGSGINPFIPPLSYPLGLAEEVSSLSIIALYVLHSIKSVQNREPHSDTIVSICDKLFLDVLVKAKIDNHVSSSALWSPHSW